MGDRIVVMKDGFIQQVGRPLELYNHPVNRFVADFLGSPSMNFFEADLVRGNGIVSINTPGFKIDLSREKSNLVRDYPGRTVIVGIRPEDLSPVEEAVAGQTIPLAIDVIEPIGSETYVFGFAGNVALTAGVGRNTEVRAHQNIHLEPIMENLHLFDIQTEKSLNG